MRRSILRWQSLALAPLLVLQHHRPVSAQQRPTLRQSFDLNVPWIPEPVNVDGNHQLVYELQLTNCDDTDLWLRQIEVLNADSGAVLANFEGTTLNNLLSPGRKDKLVIPPSFRVVTYLSVPFAPHIKHRIVYTAIEKRQQVEGGTFTARNPPPLALGPPLRGGPWVAIYSSAWERGHRRVQYAIKGSVHIPGRFAIDWIKVDEEGRHASADSANLANWYSYAAEVLAVADGVIAAAIDDLPEPPSVFAGAPVKTPLENASGNYVALDLGEGRYAFYEHLKPGSIKLKAGDHVRRGDVVGLLGYTGESTGPHLHFHVANGRTPLDAEGLPYTIQDFRILGTFPSIEAFGDSQPWPKLIAGIHTIHHGEFPAPLTVVQFQ